MKPVTFTAPALAAYPLRSLAVSPAVHPRGQPHVSAASGLVCLNGRVYVIADDEHHLAVFRDGQTFGKLHRILPGDLPESKGARKRRKPDFETLFFLPALGTSSPASLIAFGSGSRRHRNSGVVIPLGPDGEPLRNVHRFDLTPLHEPLAAALGAVNIEGAMIIGEQWVLLNRGVTATSSNAVVRYRLRDLRALIEGRGSNVMPASILRFPLASIGGVDLGFTDGCALPGGRWLFTAVAENTRDSYSDGPCTGSAVGLVSARDNLLALRRLVPPVKAEGIDARVDERGIAVCMVTDMDDPSQSAWLYQALI